MAASFPASSLFSAVIAAGAYGPCGATPVEVPVPPQVVSGVRHARVELYCGHPAQVLADIRAAAAALQELPGAPHAALLAQLSEAAWHARRGDFPAAGELLASVQARLSPPQGLA